MTLEELDRQLPYGLHDARIEHFRYDFARAELDISVTVAFDGTSELHDLFNAEGIIDIHFREVLLFAFGLPGYDSAFQAPGGVTFVFDADKTDTIPDAIANVLPSGCLKYSLYVLDTDSYMHIAARTMTIYKPMARLTSVHSV